MINRNALRAALSCCLVVCAAGAGAASNAEIAYHPALAKTRPVPAGIDASTFIPGHPAGGAPGVVQPTVARGTAIPGAATRTAAARTR